MCYLGNYSTPSTNPIIDESEPTVYLKNFRVAPPNFVDAHFIAKIGDPSSMNGFMISNDWKQFIYKIVNVNGDDIDGFCAKLCLTSKAEDCNFFVTLEGACQLGQFEGTTSGVTSVGVFTDSTTFHMRSDLGKQFDLI